MGDETLLKFLALAVRQLDAVDAKLEIGGAPPGAPSVIWVAVGRHRRLVVRLASPPADRPALTARLSALATAFVDATQPATPVVARSAPGEIDRQLAVLCEQAGANCALVIDESSPILWGSSHPEICSADALHTLLETGEWMASGKEPPARGPAPSANDAEATNRFRHAAWACRALRAQLAGQVSLQRKRWLVHSGPYRWYARRFADIYWLLLTIEAPLSEPRIEAAIRRQLPTITRLIERLPPFDPPGGRVIQLDR